MGVHPTRPACIGVHYIQHEHLVQSAADGSTNWKYFKRDDVDDHLALAGKQSAVSSM